MGLPNTPIENDHKEELEKEVCAKFGLAIRLAQAIETSLVESLAFFDLIPNIKSNYTKADLDLFRDRNYKLTMGKLINHLKKVSNIPIELESLLDQVRNKRNFLIHDYFRKRDTDPVSIKSYEEIIIELDLIIMLFYNTALMLDKIVLLNCKKQVCNMKSIVNERIRALKSYISEIDKNKN